MKKFVLLIFLIYAVTLSAQEDPASSEDNGIQFIPLPVVAYSGDTSLMLGVIGLITIPAEDPADPDDSIQLVGIYTLNNQIITSFNYKKNFEGGKFYNQGSIGYVNFPGEYFGIGPDTQESAGEKYNPVQFPLSQALMYNAADNIYVGPTYSFQYANITEKEQGGLLDRETVPGTDETIVSMPGIRFIYDTRNNGTYPVEGNYFESNISANTGALGATQDSQKFELDYRHFFNLYEREYILGIQGVLAWQHGDVPLVLMEGVGGTGVVRGYDSGRYQDKSRYGLQTELRYPYPFRDRVSFMKRLSGVVFAGIGNVAESPFDFQHQYTRWAAGAGLRLQVAPEEKVNMRFDFAVNGDGEFKPVISFMEAF